MKKYTAKVEIVVQSSRGEIFEMYDGEIPTDKELLKMHKEHLQEILKDLAMQHRLKFQITEFGEIK